jgi:hypothetical protein
VRAKLIAFLSDFRGVEKTLRVPMQPRYRGCWRCNILGVYIGTKVVYCSHWRWLRIDHPLRVKLMSINRHLKLDTMLDKKAKVPYPRLDIRSTDGKTT